MKISAVIKSSIFTCDLVSVCQKGETGALFPSFSDYSLQSFHFRFQTRMNFLPPSPRAERETGLSSKNSQTLTRCIKLHLCCCCCCCCVSSVVSDSMRPHRPQPTRLPHPWDSPGKNTGMGCHFLLQCMKVKSESEVAQSCPTLRDPMDCSPPGSSAHGIFQARVLEWSAIVFSKIAPLNRLYIGCHYDLYYWGSNQ